MKKMNSLLVTFLYSTIAISQSIKPPTGQDVANKVKAELSGWIELVNYIMLFMIFAGAIYVIASLISKRETAKGVIVAWVISMIVWGVAYSVYGERLF